MSSKRYHVSITLDLVETAAGERVLGIRGSAIAVARLAPGATIDASDAQILARAWVVRQGETLSPPEVDRVLARAA